ncbi:hypothetical protein LTR93_011926 [Exophiala xenobiotica]|nr:hypothetical protein LTR93_011926 [Exophiala xenobiotica]
MNRFNFICIFYVCCGSVLYGYDSACTTSILAYPSFLVYFNLNANTIGAMGSAYYAGAVIGMAANWYFPNKYGRLRTMQIGAVISMIAAALQTGSPNFAAFCAGIVIGGFASGLISVVCPTYASEISPPRVRGRVGGLYTFNVAMTYCLTEWVGLGFYFLKGNVSWRLLLGCQLIPWALILGFSFFMPESPCYFAYVERYDEARNVLEKMHGGGMDERFYLREFYQIRGQLVLDKEE